MLTEENLQILYRYSYVLTCNEEDAYDLLQCAVEKYLNSSQVASCKLAYIKRIIKNQHTDNYRHDKLLDFDSYDDTIIPLDNELTELEDVIINEDMVETMLLSLSPDEREIIFYWAYEGYTAQQISDTLKQPRGTVLSRLHRIRKRLIARFGPQMDCSLEAAQ
ncbi:MAG: sigma-70 family RNA polymerase sigma factor [Gammaproteobacteria bacterium]|nr:sigma-70 family RNA polymerase sigma factor [Gammaproteobacteria bacterium]